MIGTDQEPSRKVLDKLNETLGEGTYTVSYAQDAHGITGVVRTREQPPREYTTRFTSGQSPEQVEAVWLELADRASKSIRFEREQEQARASAYREPPRPAPGEQTPPPAEPSTEQPKAEATDDELAARIAARPNAEGTPDEGTTFNEASDDGDRSAAGDRARTT
jgi:hypothetical protein